MMYAAAIYREQKQFYHWVKDASLLSYLFRKMPTYILITINKKLFAWFIR